MNRLETTANIAEINIQAKTCNAGTGKSNEIAATNNAAIPIAPAIRKVGNGTSSSTTQRAIPINSQT
jgi:hypothetical protein